MKSDVYLSLIGGIALFLFGYGPLVVLVFLAIAEMIKLINDIKGRNQ